MTFLSPNRCPAGPAARCLPIVSDLGRAAAVSRSMLPLRVQAQSVELIVRKLLFLLA